MAVAWQMSDERPLMISINFILFHYYFPYVSLYLKHYIYIYILSRGGARVSYPRIYDMWLPHYNMFIFLKLNSYEIYDPPYSTTCKCHELAFIKIDVYETRSSRAPSWLAHLRSEGSSVVFTGPHSTDDKLSKSRLYILKNGLGTYVNHPTKDYRYYLYLFLNWFLFSFLYSVHAVKSNIRQ